MQIHNIIDLWIVNSIKSIAPLFYVFELRAKNYYLGYIVIIPKNVPRGTFLVNQ